MLGLMTETNKCKVYCIEEKMLSRDAKRGIEQLAGIRRNALLHPHNLTTNKINCIGNGILLMLIEIHNNRLFLQLIILSKHIRVYTLIVGSPWTCAEAFSIKAKAASMKGAIEFPSMIAEYNYTGDEMTSKRILESLYFVPVTIQKVTLSPFGGVFQSQSD